MNWRRSYVLFDARLTNAIHVQWFARSPTLPLSPSISLDSFPSHFHLAAGSLPFNFTCILQQVNQNEVRTTYHTVKIIILDTHKYIRTSWVPRCWLFGVQTVQNAVKNNLRKTILKFVCVRVCVIRIDFDNLANDVISCCRFKGSASTLSLTIIHSLAHALKPSVIYGVLFGFIQHVQYKTGGDLNFKRSSNSNSSSLLGAHIRLMQSGKAATHYRVAVSDYINGFYISAFIIEHHLIIIELNATLT